MTVNNFYTQEIKLKENSPTYTKNYRLPMSHKDEINKQVHNLRDHDLNETTISNYNSPIILVPKKGTQSSKKYRMCIDYRKVNKNLIADKFPLPRIDEILDSLVRAKYFSVLDLFSSFHQIPIHPDSRDITSSITTNGQYRWKILQYGFNISPNSFTRMMNLAFSGLKPEQSFVYIDDIIVIGKSINDHIKNLRNVFEVCDKYNLKINPNKCKFFRPEVTYLGHTCTSDGVVPDQSKYSVIKNYPIPKDKDATRRFVAFSNYYRKFIPNFATIAKPLNSLTKLNSKFIWSKAEQSLVKFMIMKKKLSHASKAFNPAEGKKAPIEQELIAIHWSIKYYRPYLYKTHFIVRSDHKPLVHLYSLKDPASRLTIEGAWISKNMILR